MWEAISRLKTMKCPNCKSENAIPIAYGVPSEETWEEVKKGNLVLGGCVIEGNEPDMFCKDC